MVAKCSLSDPILAIVINCYNYEEFVQRAIISATSQNNGRCEIVVIDDGSTDNSWEKIAEIGVRSFSKENGGQVSACLYGLDRTTAPFIMFLDADDELLPGSINKIIDSLDNNISKIQFPLIRIDVNSITIGPAFPKLKAARSRATFMEDIARTGAYVSPPTSGNVFRRDICDMLRSSNYDSAVDGVILIAAPFFGDILSLDEPLGCYRIHSKNKSGTSRVPSTDLIGNHQARFINRIAHLKKKLRDKNISYPIMNAHKMYFCMRYDLYHGVLTNRKLTASEMFALIKALPKWYSIPRKILTTIAVVGIFTLPRRVKRWILEVRHGRLWVLSKLLYLLMKSMSSRNNFSLQHYTHTTMSFIFKFRFR